MSFLHRTRLFVNDLLSPFGLAINRVGKQPWKWFRARQRPEKEAWRKIRELEAALTIQVGRYSIQIPSETPPFRVVRPLSFGARHVDDVGEKEVFLPRSG